MCPPGEILQRAYSLNWPRQQESDWDCAAVCVPARDTRDHRGLYCQALLIIVQPA